LYRFGFYPPILSPHIRYTVLQQHRHEQTILVSDKDFTVRLFPGKRDKQSLGELKQKKVYNAWTNPKELKASTQQSTSLTPTKFSD